MKSIWKFRVPIEEADGILFFERSMPLEAKIITFQMQREKAYIWAVVDTKPNDIIRRFAIIGTGQEIPDISANYIGTIQEDKGSPVWHLFEIQ
jgi:hypothetical protein